MGKVDLDPLPFKAMKASVCLKRQLPFCMGAFESMCDKRSARAELSAVVLGWLLASSSSQPVFPQEDPAVTLLPWPGRMLFCPASLPNVAETPVAMGRPGHT